MRYTLDKNNERNGLFNVLDGGKPTRAFAREALTFSDNCEIKDGEFHGGEFHGGEFRGGEFHGGWLPLQIQGSMHYLNIPDGKAIKIGCECHEPDYWQSNFERIGKENGYTDEQIYEYKMYIDLASEIIKRNTGATK